MTKIEAIQTLYRLRYGGLKECKQFVDNLIRMGELGVKELPRCQCGHYFTSFETNFCGLCGTKREK